MKGHEETIVLYVNLKNRNEKKMRKWNEHLFFKPRNYKLRIIVVDKIASSTVAGTGRSGCEGQSRVPGTRLFHCTDEWQTDAQTSVLLKQLSRLNRPSQVLTPGRPPPTY